MKTITVLGLAALAGISSCTSAVEPNRVARGAAVGAATGGVAGGPLAAAAGATIGAMVGRELEAQQRELQASIGGHGATITNTGATLVVVFPAGITFDSSSSDLTPQAAKDIAAVSASLAKYPASRVRVLGHTDDTGTTAYNQRLSERRAQAVTNILIASGTAPSRIETFGLAYKQPVASNDTPEGRARNRRVEIVIIPTAEQ